MKLIDLVAKYIDITKTGDRDVPVQSKNLPPSIDDLSPEWREFFDERAAIMEHDGQLPRPEAERRAFNETLEMMKKSHAEKGGEKI